MSSVSLAREEPKEWLGSEWYWALIHGTGHVSPNREFGERCWPPNFVLIFFLVARQRVEIVGYRIGSPAGIGGYSR